MEHLLKIACRNNEKTKEEFQNEIRDISEKKKTYKENIMKYILDIMILFQGLYLLLIILKITI